MRDVCFIADVAVLPRWMRVSQALDYVAGVHPRFDRAQGGGVPREDRHQARQQVRELSKGMVTQLHLALVMAIDAQLLVLDEPTLGLDILYRKQFYDSLLNDYFDTQPHDRARPRTRSRRSSTSSPTSCSSTGAHRASSAAWTSSSALRGGDGAPAPAGGGAALRPIQRAQLFGRRILLFDGVARPPAGGARARCARPASPTCSSRSRPHAKGR
jgi:ABC-2 type transport system ATP-binding protein